MSNKESVNFLVFSDDSTFRQDVIKSVGKRVNSTSPEIIFHEAATAYGVISQLEQEDFSVAIFDGEAQKEGAMAVSHRIHETLSEDRIPKIVFIVAREQDEWLARGANASLVLTKPVATFELQEKIAELI